VPEPVDGWWRRRQFSRGAAIPYAVGQYREQWQQYPVLVRQFHPDLNGGIVLSQVPPAADVWLLWQCEAGHRFIATPFEQRQRPGRSRRRSSWCPECAAGAGGSTRARRPQRLCARSEAQRHPIGEAFVSECAPRAASAAEPRLRQLLAQRLEFDLAPNAIRLRQPFFDHLEAWPDIVLSDLRVAIEYDTTGREGLDHVGRREQSDRRKDRALRAVGWEVVRVRTGKLAPLGSYDVVASGVSGKVVGRVMDRLCDIRGDLIVAAYSR
jgi:very-short-patch-repair endonuclease